ncbi:hypothetical protein [Sessilibacter corallicola]|uniref:Uncharacterized protein n=1 Tax=Sessilibacter corallicola TaxID=2904075 RepID=A0ABQ0A478_9GAMM
MLKFITGNIAVTCLLCSFMVSAQPFWQVKSSANGDDPVTVELSKSGSDNFKEVISSVESKGLNSIDLGRVAHSGDHRFQSQVFGYLFANHKDELSDVLAARGGAYKKALQGLEPGFKKAVLSTSLVRKLSQTLDEFCYDIDELQLKDFLVFSNNNSPNFDAYVILKVRGCARDELTAYKAPAIQTRAL